MAKTKPNIIVTGTPGVGKTSHCELLARNTGLKQLPINQIVKERGCHEGWDEEFQSWIVDEDKVGCKIPNVRRLIYTPLAAGFDRGRGKARRLHHRLARMRPFPSKLDRLGRRATDQHGKPLRQA